MPREASTNQLLRLQLSRKACLKRPSQGALLPGHFELGRDVFHCWQRAGHGMVDLTKAMMKSCDVYFYNLGVELGIDRIAICLSPRSWDKLGVRLNREDNGLIPDSLYKSTALALDRRRPSSAFYRPGGKLDDTHTNSEPLCNHR